MADKPISELTVGTVNLTMLRSGAVPVSSGGDTYKLTPAEVAAKAFLVLSHAGLTVASEAKEVVTNLVLDKDSGYGIFTVGVSSGEITAEVAVTVKVSVLATYTVASPGVRLILDTGVENTMGIFEPSVAGNTICASYVATLTTGSVFKLLVQNLASGSDVQFTGTPFQIIVEEM